MDTLSTCFWYSISTLIVTSALWDYLLTTIKKIHNERDKTESNEKY